MICFFKNQSMAFPTKIALFLAMFTLFSITAQTSLNMKHAAGWTETLANEIVVYTRAGESWCVAHEGAGEEKLQLALDYACKNSVIVAVTRRETLLNNPNLANVNCLLDIEEKQGDYYREVVGR
ncbi:hypothetical protein Leryth_001699 [Lithospermum erythrorhizon]|nr:hypothetical protein Leryth_001699 [Lithospermum erythrorhizon]